MFHKAKGCSLYKRCPRPLFMADTKGTGGLSSLWGGIERHRKQILIAPEISPLKQMSDSNPHYAQFDSFKNKSIFVCLKQRCERGIYILKSLPRPDWVLKDLIKISSRFITKSQTFFLPEIRINWTTLNEIPLFPNPQLWSSLSVYNKHQLSPCLPKKSLAALSGNFQQRDLAIYHH
jgi:hypothetical protein